MDKLNHHQTTTINQKIIKNSTTNSLNLKVKQNKKRDKNVKYKKKKQCSNA